MSEPFECFPPYVIGRAVRTGELPRREARENHDRFVADIPKLAELFADAAGVSLEPPISSETVAAAGRWFAERVRTKPSPSAPRHPYDEGPDLSAPTVNAAIYLAAFLAVALTSQSPDVELRFFVGRPKDFNHQKTVVGSPHLQAGTELEPLQLALNYAYGTARNRARPLEDLFWIWRGDLLL